MGRLEYDDNGFTYFGIGLATSFLVPYTLNLVWATGHTLMGTGSENKPRTALEAAKAQRSASEVGVKGVLAPKSLKRWAMVVIGWLFVVYLFSFTGVESDIDVFDPWKILGIDEGSVDDPAVQKAIKSSYRKLSLKHHPDRNRDKELDEQATSAMLFERVQKAHEILTKEEAYSMFQKTGSPDGSSDMQLSIGLPKFLMDKRNHNLVLVVYLLILVVIIPIAVGSWYAQSKQFGDKLIMNDSYNIFAHLLEKTTKLENMPEILALSAEFRTLPQRTPKEEELLKALEARMKEEGKMVKEPARKVVRAKMLTRWAACARANVLIHAYLNRLAHELSPGLRDDLDFILKKSKLLVEAMNEAVFYTRNVDSMREIIKFEQCVSQALWIGDSPFKQLPHIDSDIAEKIKTPFPEFLASPEKTDFPGVADADKKEISQAVKLFPKLNTKVTIGVVEQENRDGTLVFEKIACEGDIMTAFVEVERLHNVDRIHAPYLPFDKEESYTVLFCVKGQKNILALSKLGGAKQILRSKIQFPSKNFLKPGTEHEFDFHILSTGYLGCDQLVRGTIKVEPEGTVKPIQSHIEDINLDKEPTLFEEAFGKQGQSDDSDFADSDDEEEEETEDAASGNDLVASDDEGDSSKQEKKKDK